MGGECRDTLSERQCGNIDSLKASLLILLTDHNSQGLLFLHLISVHVMDWEDADVLFGDISSQDKPPTICQWIINYIKNESQIMSEICYKQIKEWIKDQMCNPN